MSRPSFDDFKSCLKQDFRLDQEDYEDTLQLIKVERLEKAQSVDDGNPFSIIFQSRSQQMLPQQIYQLANENMGDLQLFIVPIAQDESGVRYEAVFS